MVERIAIFVVFLLLILGTLRILQGDNEGMHLIGLGFAILILGAIKPWKPWRR